MLKIKTVLTGALLTASVVFATASNAALYRTDGSIDSCVSGIAGACDALSVVPGIVTRYKSDTDIGVITEANISTQEFRFVGASFIPITNLVATLAVTPSAIIGGTADGDVLVSSPLGDFPTDLVLDYDKGTWQALVLGGLVTVNGTILGTSVIPVPAAAWLFGSALMGLAGVARRRRAS